MRMRSLVLAAVLAGAGPAFAEAPKNAQPQATQPQPQPPVVVLAAADSVKSAASDAAQAAPVQTKHRIARVTTCRCGDPEPGQASEENPEQ